MGYGPIMPIVLMTIVTCKQTLSCSQPMVYVRIFYVTIRKTRAFKKGEI